MKTDTPARPGAALSDLVHVRAGGIDCAFRTEDLLEVVRMVALAPAPSARPGVLGMIDLRGRLSPVLDLRVLLEVEAAAPSVRTPILILAVDDSIAGVVVDEVVGVVRLDRPPPIQTNMGNDLITAILPGNGKLLSLLDGRTLIGRATG